MLFLMIGLLKPEVHEIPQKVQRRVNDFLGQPVINIRTAGALRNHEGTRAGMMIIVDVEDRRTAENFLAGSPYREAGLYESFRIFEYASEVGGL